MVVRISANTAIVLLKYSQFCVLEYNGNHY